MAEKVLLSTAYFPPLQYFSFIYRADKIFIEKEENYLKQTYRNRCKILTANGPYSLSIPILSGSAGKTPVRNTRIDYSKRWQQVHLRALISSYKSSAYFEYYFDDIEKIISGKQEYLFELNHCTLDFVLKIIGISKPIGFTKVYEPSIGNEYDYRYNISPKKEMPLKFSRKEYYQVFSQKFGFVPGLSILDLIFNVGPDSLTYL